MENQSLVHHGVKGQRWGVRRYQRPDGSLTREGKRRVSSIYQNYYTKGSDELKKAQVEINRKATKDSLKAYNDTMDRFNKKFGNELSEKMFIKAANAVGEAEDLQLSASKAKYTADFVKNKTEKMDKWDKLASSTQKQLENYSNTNVNVDVVSEVMKKYS